ncbi:MAG: HAD-IC family P-type ATPase, partial [Thermomicrobiaceae bacterium]|nr:HAD-IC family P-type ATPase [Thermomicrobiaceae bacterium]
MTSRPYRRIFRDNALTPINVVLYVVAALLVGLGRPGDAVTTVGLIALNVLVGIVQEGRAKRQLDRLALLTRPRACVLRDGEEHLVDPSEVVRGDVLILRPGDQAVVDGPILRAAGLRLDESLLTGEADPVAKHPGEIVYSGSVCVAGAAVFRADAVGRASRAQRITARARAFRNVQTPLQRQVNGVIRAMAVLAMLIGIGAALSYYRESRHLAVVQSVQAAAVIVGLVPQGLSAMTTVTYAMAALRMAGKGAVIQRINAVESTSHVDVLCLDKTGTLTTNQLEVREVRALAPGLDASDARMLLGRYAASVTVANRTVEALRAACPSPPGEVLEEVPFSSSRKWSALVVQDEGRPRTLVLGAPDVLSPRLVPGGLQLDLAEEWASRGLRVLL